MARIGGLSVSRVTTFCEWRRVQRVAGGDGLLNDRLDHGFFPIKGYFSVE